MKIKVWDTYIFVADKGEGFQISGNNKDFRPSRSNYHRGIIKYIKINSIAILFMTILGIFEWSEYRRDMIKKVLDNYL